MKESYLELSLEYWKTEGIKLKHTKDSSSGEIDVEQVAKGKEDIFLSEDPAKSLEKKKIIITDWDVFYNPKLVQYKDKKINFYQKLLNDGFELYRYYEENLVRLNSIDDLSRFDIQIASDRLIKIAAAKMGFASNEIFISSPIRVLQFIDENEYSFKVSDFNYEKELFLEILNKGSTKLTLISDENIYYNDSFLQDYDISEIDKIFSLFDSLTVDVYSFNLEEYLNNLLLKLPNIKSIDFIKVENAGANFFLNNIPKQVRKINISGTSAKLYQWTINSSLDDIIIKFKLDKLWILRNHDISYCNNILSCGGDIKVKEFYLYNIKAPANIFNSLSKSANKVEMHNIGIINYSRDQLFPDYSVDALRILIIRHMIISFKQLIYFTKKRELQEVSLFSVDLTGVVEDSVFPSTVKKITLDAITITYKNLNHLIKECRDLVEINLNNVALIGDVEPLNTKGKLNVIDIKYARMNFEDLKKFLQNCQHLEILNLNRALGFADPIDQRKLEENLKDRIYGYFNKVLTYFREETASNSQEYYDLTLPNTLKALDLSHSDVGPKVLKEIMETLKLEVFDITGCFNVREFPRRLSIPTSYRIIGVENNFIKVDDKTESKDPSLSYTEYFKPKPEGPRIYASDLRLKIYTSFDLNKGVFSHETHPADFSTVEVSIKRDLAKIYADQYVKKRNYFLGKKEISDSVEHIILPSLHHKDELVGLEIFPYQYYSVVRCSKDDLYYLKFKNSARPGTKVYFIIKSPYGQSSFFTDLYDIWLTADFSEILVSNPLTKLKFTDENRLNAEELYDLPDYEKILRLKEYFDGFENKKLSQVCNTPRERMNAIMEERAGICRHGAQAFMAAAMELKLTVRSGSNDIHQFVEIYSNQGWDHLDFGGDIKNIKFEVNGNGWAPENLNPVEGNWQWFKKLRGLSDSNPNGSQEPTSVNSDWKIYTTFGFVLGGLLILAHKAFASFFNKYQDKVSFISSALDLILPYLPSIPQLIEVWSNKFRKEITDSYRATSGGSFVPDFSNKEYESPKKIAGSSRSNPEENDFINYNILLIVIAAASSATLLAVAAKYFYNKYKNQRIIDAEVAAPEVVELVAPKVAELDVEETDDVIAREPDIPSENPFMPQREKEISAINMKEYVRSVLDQAKGLDRKNILCIMEETQIEEFYNEVLAARKDSYFISDLDEVSLQNTVVNDGEINREDSKLSQLLKLPQGVLVIDWSNCQPQNIGLNSVIDTEIKVNGQRVEQRRIDISTLRQEMVVISILKKDIKLGDDFYSRQKVINTLPKELAFQVQEIVSPAISDSNQVEILFYDGDWKQKIFGRIKIEQEEGYFYKLSELHSHVVNGQRDIILRNAPWEEREFRLAIKDIEERGIIFANGKEYKCKNIKFIRSDVPYSQEGLTRVEFNSDVEYQTVNQANFQKLFERYSIENRKLVIEEEFVKRKLLVTEDLSLNQWVKLAAIDAEVFDGSIDVADRDLRLGNENAKIVITNDIGLSKKAYSGKIIIHISTETSVSELVEQIIYFKDSRLFEHRVSLMAKALLAGEEVVLVGNISKNLMNHLSSLFINKPYLMINGKRVALTGKITLITEKVPGLGIFIKEEKIFSKEEIWDAVKESHPLELISKLKNLCSFLPKEIADFSYTQIKSILHRMELKPDSNPFKHLFRLRPDYQELKPKLEVIWAEEYNALASMFEDPSINMKPTRLEKVVSEAKISPVLFIVGPSGAGKSTFMRKDLSALYDICEGMKSLDKLTEKSITGKPRALFIDEANMVVNPAIYEQLNGISDGNMLIPVGQELKEIIEGNIIIFVGNYGHFRGRKTIRLIEEHGSIISFKALSDEIIKTKIIKPILSELYSLKIESEDLVVDINYMADSLIKAYHYINDMRPEEELLTARNIEMMCFRSKKLEHDGIANIKLRSVISVYDEVSVMLTKSERKDLRSWLEENQELDHGIIKLEKTRLKNSLNIEEFFVSHSRKNMIRLLEYMTFIRDLKIDNDQIDATAISGILFEGSSGSGKSYIAIKFLEYLGFSNAAKNPDAIKKYYVITPTNFMRAEADLLRLVDEGAVILVDEINTMPLEEVLNSLLSGVDLHGVVAKSKGGLLIATQNPISYGNRLAFSEALNKRFQKIIVKDLKKPELTEMLESIIKDDAWGNWIEAIIDYYLEAIKYTQKYNIPSPNLRQLTEYVDHAQNEFNSILEIIDEQERGVIDNQGSLAMVPYDSAKALVYTMESTTLKAINMALDFRLPNIMLSNPYTSLTLQLSSDVMDEDMVLVAGVDNIEFSDIFLSSNGGSAIQFSFFSNLFESFTTKLLENSNIRYNLLNYIYRENIIEVQALISKEYIRNSIGLQRILAKSPFDWKKGDFHKISLIVHPDKGGDVEDFKIIQSFREKYQENLDHNLFAQAFEKLAPIAQQFISKAIIGVKLFDTVIDGARLAYEPNITHVKTLALDTTYLYGIYSGVNGYSSAINLIDVSYKLYNSDYMGAIQQTAMISAYMALPSVIAATGIPYVGLVYSSAMLGYIGYSAISNAYSFYKEFGTDEFNVKSYTNYKDISEYLSSTPLQSFYDFEATKELYELNLLRLELNRDMQELQTEIIRDESEFSQKLYKYIVVPQFEKRYELFNQAIKGEISKKQYQDLEPEIIEDIKIENQNYNFCIDSEEDYYYCYNAQDIAKVIIIEGLDPLLIAHL